MNTVVVGAQWGDEGKGKIIDLLTEEADIVVRYQGGNNAGHTVVVGEREFVFHLIPSGILHPGKTCVIGNGVVVDPEALLAEVAGLRKHGVTVGRNLLVSDQAHLILPYHKLLDRLQESKRCGRIGTTGRGIGPCYEDKMARVGIRLADLFDKEALAEKLRSNLREKNELFTKIYRAPTVAFQPLYTQYLAYGRRLAPHAVDCSTFLNGAIVRRKHILFEGAQGTLLDIDYGTYPYVTSSNASAGGACTGTGVGPTKIDRVIGVVKAYTTRVGEGPFPTEFPPILMDEIRHKGREYGATTGRPRRCGWFDAVIVRHAARINGMDAMAVTKLDVLDDMASIKICVGYRHRGRRYSEFPADIALLSSCRPMYEEHPGWRQDTTDVESFHQLPRNAQRYLRRIAALVGIPICLVSIGLRRTQAFRTNLPGTGSLSSRAFGKWGTGTERVGAARR